MGLASPNSGISHPETTVLLGSQGRHIQSITDKKPYVFSNWGSSWYNSKSSDFSTVWVKVEKMILKQILRMYKIEQGE